VRDVPVPLAEEVTKPAPSRVKDNHLRQEADREAHSHGTRAPFDVFRNIYSAERADDIKYFAANGHVAARREAFGDVLLVPKGVNSFVGL
jgi:hypothetical protein